jgi:hypothetical protein
MGAFTFADPVTGAPSFTGKIFRSLLSALMGGGKTTRPFGSRSGVAAGTLASIVSATSTVWTVTPFCGFLDTSAGATDGATPFAFTTNQTGAVTAADATSPRVDSLFVRLDDPSEGDGSSVPAPVIQYVAGAPGTAGGARGAAGGPPAIPARSFELAQLNVPVFGGGSPSVSWVAPYVVAAGGIVPVSGASQYPSSPYVGQYVDDVSLGLMRWTGSAWAAVADGSAFTPWTAYTPVSNFGTIGAGTIDGWYKQIGTTVHYRIRMTLGTGSSGPGAGVVFTWSLPVKPTNPFGGKTPMGQAEYYGGALVVGSVMVFDTTGTGHVQALFHGETTAAQTGSPGSWVPGVTIILWGTYEAA